MTDPSPTLLVVEEQPDMLAALVRAFSEAGYKTYGASDLAVTQRIVQKHHPDVLVFDPACLKAGLADVLRSASTPGPPPRTMRLFALCRLPYDAASCQAADHHAVKVITMPMPMGDLVNAIRLHLSLLPSRIHYEQGLYDMIRASIEQVIGHYLQTNLQIDTATIKRSDRLDGEIVAVIPVSGTAFLGTIALCFDKEFALALARAMVGDTDGTATFTDHEIVDVVSETSNQLAGLVQERLIASGWQVNIGLPKALTGANVRFIHPGRNKVAFMTLGLKRRGGLFGKLSSLLKARTTVEFCFDEFG